MAEHVEWAYALTVHTGQGQAADHVHVLAAPSLYQELAVVAGSRHRHTVTWHLCAGAAEHLRGPRPRPTVDDVARWANQPRAERFAHVEPEPVQPSLAELYNTRDESLAVLNEHHQRQRAVDKAARDRAILKGRLEQLRAHRTQLEHQRRRSAARTIQLPQRPLRRTTRHALQHAQQDLDRADHDLATNQADIDKVTADSEQAHTRMTAARRHLDDHQPQAADAKRTGLRAELTIANRTQALGIAATHNQPRHIIEILGPPPPDNDRRDRWIAKAGDIEAYRERWSLTPETVIHRPDPPSPAAHHWRQVIAPHLAPQLDRRLEHESPSISR